MQRPPHTGLLRTVPVGLSAALGIGIVLTSSRAVRAASLWWVWAPLAVALTTTGGAILVYGLDRWAELTSDHPTSVRQVAPRIAAIGTIAAVSVLGAQLLLAGPTPGTWRFLGSSGIATAGQRFCVEITAHGHDGVAVRGGSGGLQEWGHGGLLARGAVWLARKAQCQPLRDP